MNIFWSIEWNWTIASNNQRVEHNCLASNSLNPKTRTHESPWALQEPLACLLTKCEHNNNGQGSHWGLLSYDKYGWKCELDELTHPLSKISLNFRGPFCTSPLCVLCMILFLTLTLVHTCYEKSTPRSIGQRKISTLKNIKFYLIKGIFPLGILTITHVWSRNLKEIWWWQQWRW